MSSKDTSCDPNYVCVLDTRTFLLGGFFGTSNSPALTSISSYSIIPDSFERWHVFKWIVISSWHSRNLHTVSEPRKPPQLDFPKPEKEHFTVSVAVLPLVQFCVQSRRTGDEIQSLAYFNFNPNWVKSLCQRLIAFYLQRKVFYLLQKFPRDVSKSNLNEQDCIQLILAKDLSGRCHEPVTLVDINASVN